MNLCDMPVVLSSPSPSVITHNQIQISYDANGYIEHDKHGGTTASEDSGVISYKEYCEGTSSSSGDSFVDAILDRDSEIRAGFPELLDGSFDY